MRWIGLLAVVWGLGGATGCTCRARYDGFLGSVEDGLRADVRPKYERALRASGRAARLVENDLALLDEILRSIADVRSGTRSPDEATVAATNGRAP